MNGPSPKGPRPPMNKQFQNRQQRNDNNSHGGGHNPSMKIRPGKRSGGPPGGPQGPREINMNWAPHLTPEMAGPTINLPAQERTSKEKQGVSRLYVGNFPPGLQEDELKKEFTAFGELGEFYLNKEKCFAFVKLPTREAAEKARDALEGKNFKGRNLRIRFAPTNAVIKVRNLSPFVSNELLEYAFSAFGEVEMAQVITDERGKPTGDGVVEFTKKPTANVALKRCQEDCFLITSYPRPVIVESTEHKDEEEGLSEKIMIKNNQYKKEREMGPRFAHRNSFEYEFAQKWKDLFAQEKQERERLEQDFRLRREKMEESMEYAIYDAETNMLREKLRQREEESNRFFQRHGEMSQQQQRHQGSDMSMRSLGGDRHQGRADLSEMGQSYSSVSGLPGASRQNERSQSSANGGNSGGGFRLMGPGGDVPASRGGGRKTEGDDSPASSAIRLEGPNDLFMQANQLASLLDKQEAQIRQGPPAGTTSNGAQAPASLIEKGAPLEQRLPRGQQQQQQARPTPPPAQQQPSQGIPPALIKQNEANRPAFVNTQGGPGPLPQRLQQAAMGGGGGGYGGQNRGGPHGGMNRGPGGPGPNQRGPQGGQQGGSNYNSGDSRPGSFRRPLDQQFGAGGDPKRRRF